MGILKRLCCCNFCLRKTTTSDYEKISKHMADTNTLNFEKDDKLIVPGKDADIPQRSRDLRVVESFSSLKLSGEKKEVRRDRRHSSPALPLYIPESDVQKLYQELNRRQSSASAPISTGSFKKSTYQESKLAEIDETTENEATVTGEHAQNECLGIVHFSVTTLPELNQISVDVEKVQDLPPRGSVRSYYSVVQLCIKTGKEQIHSSKPTLSPSPIINETFKFNVKSQESYRDLLITLFDFDKKDLPIGHAVCRLVSEDMSAKMVRHYQTPLSRQTTIQSKLGDILISAVYAVVKNELSINVLRGRNIPSSTSATTEVYLKAKMVCGGEKIKSKKSNLVQRTENPLFNHTFSFVVPSFYLDVLSVEVKLTSQSLLKKNADVGRVIINPFTRHSDSQLCFWQRLVTTETPCKKWFAMSA